MASVNVVTGLHSLQASTIYLEIGLITAHKGFKLLRKLLGQLLPPLHL